MTRNLFRSLLSVVLTGGVTLSACENRATSEESQDAPAAELRSRVLYTPEESLPSIPQITPPHPFVGKQVWISQYFGKYGSRCLSPTVLSMAASTVAAGSPMVANTCFQTDPNWQRFTVQQTLVLWDKSQVSLRSVQWPDLCLAVRGGTTVGGELMELAKCSSATSQRFRLPQPSSATLAQGAIRTMVSDELMALEMDRFSVQLVCDVSQRPLVTNRVPQYWSIRVQQ